MSVRPRTFAAALACLPVYFLAVCLTPAHAAPGLTIYVSTTGNDSNDGTSLTAAKKTIQAGIIATSPNSATKAGTVLVEPGTYTGTGNVNIDFGSTGTHSGLSSGTRSVTIEADTANGGGPTNTIININGTNGNQLTGFKFSRQESSSARVIGFTLENGNQDSTYGGAIVIGSGASPIIQNCIFLNNEAALGGAIETINGSPTIRECSFINNKTVADGSGFNPGGAIEINETDNGAYTPSVTNCIFTGNSSSTDGGAIDISGYSGAVSPKITNCTFTGNASNYADSNDPGGTIGVYAAAPVITNCILYGDTVSGSTEVATINGASSNITVKDSDIQQPTGTYPGSGNLNVDPKFAANDDLAAGSPAINAGTTSVPGGVDISIDRLGHPRDSQPDLGAYEVLSPTAIAQSGTTAFNTPTGITLTGSDPNLTTRPLTYAIASNPAHGTLTGTAPNVTYTPAAGYNGADSFTFTVNNGTYTSTAATVTINVATGTPSANAQSVVVPFNTAKSITLTGSDPNNPPLSLSYALGTQPTHGALSGTAPNLTYTPAAGYQGADSFTFTVNNGTATSSAATVTLNVAAGTPTANAQTISVAFNTAASITLTGSDPDNPALALTYALSTQPTHGTLSGTAPSLTYTPNAGYQGADSFTFTVNNSTNTSSPATVTLSIASGTPTANAQSVSTSQNTATSITLTGSDPNNPPLVLTYTLSTQPAHGTLTGTAPNLIYTPAPGYFGPDSFTFAVSNGVSTSTSATVSITVVQAVPATVTAASIAWGTAGTAALVTNADGLRLLPAGRSTDLPWLGLSRITLTLSRAVALSAADVSVTGIAFASYGPVTVTGSGTSYTLTLAQPISAAERVTLTIGNANLATYTRRLDILPGDASDDGTVSSPDAVQIRNMYLGIGGASPTIFGDINGDGTIDVSDYNAARQRIGTHLP